MTVMLVGVKTYHLSTQDQGITIEFSMEDPNEMNFIYTDSNGEHQFSGRAIYRDETQMGLVASVVLETIPDAETTTISLIVPEANRLEAARSVQVKAVAIKTTHLTSIAGPDIVEGQIKNYQAYDLEGNAW